MPRPRLTLLVLGLALLPGCAPDTMVGVRDRVDLRRTDGSNGDGGLDLVDMARNTTSCSGGGTPCSSGNPGACDPGTVTCVGTQAECTPDSTVQDCYEGPPGTAGIGICRSGAQSCIGILGPCQGQIMPAVQEDCANDLDDDCDGTANNGCPEGVGVGTARPVAPLAGASGNAGAMDLSARCPEDAFVTALAIEFQDQQLQVAGLRLSCAKALLTRSGGDYILSTQPVTPAPYATLMAAPPAVGTGTPIAASCAGVGLRAMFSTRGSFDEDGGLGGITGFLTQCGLVSAELDPASNTLGFSVEATGNELGYDYGVQLSSETPVSWACDTGEVVIGYDGRVSTCGLVSSGMTQVPGACLDMLQPVCAPLEAKYKP